MPNMNYWANRQQRQEHATMHTMLMEQKYAMEIEHCVDRSIIYSPDSIFKTPRPRFEKTNFSLENEGSVDAIMRLSKTHMAVLNFASYTHPGGQFLKGSSAQEEALCHESTLYNVLSEMPNYYDENGQTRNNFMYHNRAIFSPDIIFVRDGKEVVCDVITCASPNLSGNKKYSNVKVSPAQNAVALRERCRFVLQVARAHKVDTLILGAFGCGVFGQSAEKVAAYFTEFLMGEFKGCFRDVVYAVPIIANPENHDGFKKILKNAGLI